MTRVSAPVTPPSQTTDSWLTAFKYTSNITRSWRPSASPSSLNDSLQVHDESHSITTSKWISNPIPLRPPTSHHYSLHVHLPIRSFTASKCAWSKPPNLLNHGFRGHLEVYSITVWWNGGALRQAAHYQYSATPLMVSDRNSWSRVALARRGWDDT